MFTKKLFLTIALLISFGCCPTVQSMQVSSSLVAAIGLACDIPDSLINFGTGFMIGLTSPISLPFSWFFIPKNEQEYFDDKGKLNRPFFAGAITGVAILGFMIYKSQPKN